MQKGYAGMMHAKKGLLAGAAYSGPSESLLGVKGLCGWLGALHRLSRRYTGLTVCLLQLSRCGHQTAIQDRGLVRS